APKAAAETNRQGPIDLLGSAFLGGSISRTVEHTEDFAGVGQAEHQRVIAPSAVVSNVHASLALARRFNEKAIHVQNCLLEEGRWLAAPHFDPRGVDNVQQRLNAIGRKPPTEISGRRWIGEATGPQGIEQDFIVAEQFQVLQTGTATQGQVSQGEYVVRFVVGQVDLEQVEVAVDGL